MKEGLEEHRRKEGTGAGGGAAVPRPFLLGTPLAEARTRWWGVALCLWRGGAPCSPLPTPATGTRSCGLNP